MSRPEHLEEVPAHRAKGDREVAHALLTANRIVPTTHVNADGDGLGSEVALVHLLLARGKDVAIVNPTLIPERYRFMTGPIAARDKSREARETIRSADL